MLDELERGGKEIIFFKAPIPISPMQWYTAAELRDYLVNRNYSEEIAKELCEQYAKNLQDAFDKGRSVERNR